MSFALADYLPYLVNRIGARMAEGFSAEVARFGVSLPEWRVLAALWPDHTRSQIELAALTSIETSTLSRLLTAMERRGLVQRTRSRDDARVVGVAASAKGKETTRSILPLAQRTEAMAVAGLNPTEVKRLKALLVRVFANLPAPVSPRRGSAARAGLAAGASASADSPES
jgi:MarR family transcriptional regulator, organic hydroperoxide resistance regulator